MSWWTDARDATEATFAPEFESDSARKRTTGYTGALNRAYSGIGGAFNKVIGRESSADKRTQMQAIYAQTQAYKDQTAITQKQIDDTRAQEDVQKRKIEEKQIRALRGGFRPAGGYSAYNSGTSGGAGGLGSDNQTPSKLGTA